MPVPRPGPGGEPYRVQTLPDIMSDSIINVAEKVTDALLVLILLR